MEQPMPDFIAYLKYMVLKCEFGEQFSSEILVFPWSDTGSHSLIIAYVFCIYTHIWTSHENFLPNSQHVRTHMSLFLNSFFC